ncbi:MAG: deoxyribodipyrimidine photolyase, partial [Planctomycetes bacterium]|nr:deoxyribodipyrimidine photolyase [Planctomycetota bacterium]
EGMADNAAAFADTPVRYYPYVEPAAGAGSGLLEALAAQACVVVTDEFPCFFLPRMIAAAAGRVDVRMEQVDSNGLLPIRAPGDRVFGRAVDLRRWLQKNLAPHLRETPRARPLAQLGLAAAHVPQAILDRWPAASAAMLRGDADELAALPIDHGVEPVTDRRGGHGAARERLTKFLDSALGRYDEDRNHPDREGGSGLSPWLHFGHLSVHEVLAELGRREDWTPDAVGTIANGKREGWWHMSAAAESFLDELVTWREIGLNFCARRADYDRYDSLPDWAKATLGEHEKDRRPHLYTFDELDEARTADPIWNAAQRELRRDGRIHNYLRMLWGKRVLEWSPTPEIAVEILIELNNRYALDGRDPNSYSGIFWVFGRYDRPWVPERPVFGNIRFMSSERTPAKVRMREYLAEFGS